MTGRPGRLKAAAALKASVRAEQVYVRDLRAIMAGVHAGYLRALAPELKTDAHTSHGETLRLLGVKVVTHVRTKVGAAFDKMASKVDKKSLEAMSSLVAIAPHARTAGVIAQFRQQNIDLIEKATLVYHSQVEDVLNDPDNFGLRVEDLADKLKERGDVSESRAELIARDRTLKLNGQLAMTRQTNAGISQYTWSTSGDERVRPEHRDLDGTLQDWSSPPDTGDGDNHPGQDYQCRCVAIPVIPGLDG